jgi:hypothetical protein
MEAPNGEFNFTRLEWVIFDPGKVAASPRELDRRGLKLPHNEIDQVAAPVLDEVARSKVVDRPVTRKDIVSLLEAAYWRFQDKSLQLTRRFARTNGPWQISSGAWGAIPQRFPRMGLSPFVASNEEERKQETGKQQQQCWQSSR